MQIETYEIEEVTNEAQTLVADHEAIELIERLGLTGQQSLSNKKTETRMPYPEMTADEAFVYETLFPSKSEVKNYSSGIIPIRVLQVIAFLKDNDFFKKLEIWHSQGRRDKDPVLVGYATDPECTWREKTYLIARWGEALLPLDKLMVQAKTIAFGKLKAKATQALSEATMLSNQIEMIKDPQICSIELLQKNPCLSGT